MALADATSASADNPFMLIGQPLFGIASLPLASERTAAKQTGPATPPHETRGWRALWQWPLAVGPVPARGAEPRRRAAWEGKYELKGPPKYALKNAGICAKHGGKTCGKI